MSKDRVQWAFATCTEQLHGMATGQIRSRDLVETYLARIEENKELNAVVSIAPERARAEADRMDAERASGRQSGRLHGIPVTLKDSFETEGLRTTAGSESLAEYEPSKDAPTVARLRQQGAIIMGKTNMPTFNLDLQAQNPVFGATKNPHDPSRTSGGSAGGAAAAVAAALTSIDYCSEIAGSIRIPAHYCGVFGHKSSYGISKLTGHLPHGPGDGFWSWLDLAVGGPMTRSAEDLQVGLLAGAGADPAEATGWKLSLPAPRARRLQHFRLAAWLDDAFCPIDSEVRKAIESAVESIRSKGGTVDTSPKLPMQLEEMTLPYRKLLYGAFAAFWPEEEFEEMRKVSTPGGRYQGHPDKPRVYADTVGDHRDWVRADIARNHAKAAWSEFFATYDAVLMPVTPTPALPHHGPDEAWFGPPMKVDGETRPYLDQISWTGFVNYIGNPSTSVPLSMSKDGLPIGMQLMGPYLEDLTVIELARALEQAGVAQYVQPAPLRS